MPAVQPLKILLMAYECSPYRGSEWAVGWGRLLQSARAYETHVITSEANFEALERARREGLVPPNVHFHTPSPDAELRSLERNPVLFAYNYTAYHHWQKLALELAKELHACEQFSVVHQVNVCTFREPGYTWQLGIPYVWGPVGGSQNYPLSFLPMLPPVEALKEAARGVSNRLSLHRKQRVRKAAAAAAHILAANSTNQRDYRQAFGRDVELLLETGLHAVEPPDRSRFEARAAAQRERRPAPPLNLLWSGEMQTRKALPILLRALAMLRGKVEFRLRVLGDGPMRERWQRESERLGVRDRVEFLGRLPFAEAVSQMRHADVFVFTSLRDTSGNVILEAFAAGVPVICFNHQGAGDMVDDESGVRLPVKTPRDAVRRFAGAIEALSVDADRLLQLSHGATERASHYLWDRNGDRMNALYRQLAETRGSAEKTL